MKKGFSYLAGLLMAASLFIASQGFAQTKNQDFKVVGYVVPNQLDPAKVPYQYLTHINYSFSIPEKASDGTITDVPQPDLLRELVKQAHKNGVKVFISIGGWGVGDGGGDDTRFEVLANTDQGRKTFAQETLKLIQKYNLDGADIDWEYPDPIEPSSSNYVELMKDLRNVLHPAGKELTAAIVSYHDSHGYGIKKEIFDIADWLNIMAYDDDYNSFGGNYVPHAPYWLAVRAFDYWVDDRGLSKEKAIMGVPFYGKGKNDHRGGYAQLLERGADPYADFFDGLYYNGIKTMKDKTKLSMKRGGGIMIWQIGADAAGEFSLLKAIHDAQQE